MTRILILEDDARARSALGEILRQEGHEVREAATAAEARAALEQDSPDALVADLVLDETRPAELGGLAVALEAVRARPDLVVLVLTAYGSVQSAVHAIRKGIYDYLEKPVEIERLLAALHQGLELRRHPTRHVSLAALQPPTLVGHAPLFEQARRDAMRAAGRNVTVLLRGETGTGKGCFARAIHEASLRRHGPFVELPLVALSEDVAESELFGYERGAFTGADRAGKHGRLEMAQGGTLFLDEIGEISPRLQLKLLNVLESRRFVRVGGAREVPLDARILAATSRDLEAAVRGGAFRQELYYRVAVYPIHLPLLRERPGDAQLLAQHFVRTYTQKHGTGPRHLTPQALARLEALPWPGNVRELEHAIERAVLASEGEEIGAALFQEEPAHADASLRGRIDLEEREALTAALTRTHGNRAEAARLLGISLRSLFYKLKKHGLGGAGEEE